MFSVLELIQLFLQGGYEKVLLGALGLFGWDLTGHFDYL